DRLGALVAIEPKADAVRRLSAVIDSDPVLAEAVAARLRLSAKQRERLIALAAPPWPVDLDGDEREQRRALFHLGADLYRDLVLLRGAETGKVERARVYLAPVEAWWPIEFPLKGRDVAALGVAAGPEIGRRLAEIETWWEAGDFRADRAVCLAELERRLGRR
ncbi:MAG TPA: CCA tRNA nucleotidyltransferase, partial [Stellaceae bacterium]|nr:CCA tRNA nucleotidyltransferase [Stellaceae bacterium]